MAKFEQHMQYCKEQFGAAWNLEIEKLAEIINHEIDKFAWPDQEVPPKRFYHQHRRFLHHREGIAWFGIKYGAVGYKIAQLHVMLDCGGRVPNAIEYYNGKLDDHGLPWY